MERNNSSSQWHSLPLSSLLLSSLLLLLYSATPTAAAAAADGGEDAAAICRFRDYLRINTSHPKPDYAGAKKFLLEQAKDIGLDEEVLEFAPDKPLVLLTWPGRNASLGSVLLNSHTDVVPAEPDKWAHPPFSAFLDQATGNI